MKKYGKILSFLVFGSSLVLSGCGNKDKNKDARLKKIEDDFESILNYLYEDLGSELTGTKKIRDGDSIYEAFDPNCTFKVIASGPNESGVLYKDGKKAHYFQEGFDYDPDMDEDFYLDTTNYPKGKAGDFYLRFNDEEEFEVYTTDVDSVPYSTSIISPEIIYIEENGTHGAPPRAYVPGYKNAYDFRLGDSTFTMFIPNPEDWTGNFPLRQLEIELTYEYKFVSMHLVRENGDQYNWSKSALAESEKVVLPTVTTSLKDAANKLKTHLQDSNLSIKYDYLDNDHEKVLESEIEKRDDGNVEVLSNSVDRALAIKDGDEYDNYYFNSNDVILHDRKEGPLTTNIYVDLPMIWKLNNDILPTSYLNTFEKLDDYNYYSESKDIGVRINNIGFVDQIIYPTVREGLTCKYVVATIFDFYETELSSAPEVTVEIKDLIQDCFVELLEGPFKFIFDDLSQEVSFEIKDGKTYVHIVDGSNEKYFLVDGDTYTPRMAACCSRHL